MASQPIATWTTPCNSRSVKLAGTRTRRHTIGLTPSSHTLICTMSPAAAADDAGLTAETASLRDRVISVAYCRPPPYATHRAPHTSLCSPIGALPGVHASTSPPPWHRHRFLVRD